MDVRRAFLLLGLVMLCLSAARRVDAQVAADVEGTAYGGSASGGWACGPNARAHYGGVGGEVRVRVTDDPPADDEEATSPNAAREEHKAEDEYPETAQGGVFTAAGVLERRSFVLVDCGSDPCSGSNTVVPPATTMVAGKFGGGYDWRWFGFRAGGVGWERFAKNDDRLPTPYLWPDVALRVGPLDSFRAEIGVGSYTASTLLRPGGYIGLAYAPAPGWDIALHGGGQVTFDGGGSFRGDLALRVPVTRRLQLGGGVALSQGVHGSADPEGRGFLIGHF